MVLTSFTKRHTTKDWRNSVQIELKGRNVPVNDELRAHVRKRFDKIGRSVSDLARLELELHEERNPVLSKEKWCVSATLYLKGATLHASDHSGELKHSIHLVEQELCRQVMRHRAKSRHRREARQRDSGVGAQAGM